MEKEKEAYSRWLHKLPDLSDDEKRFLECVRKDHRVDESVVLFYAGHHSRDEEFAALKAEIERKDELLRDILNSGRCNAWQETDERIGYVDLQVDKSTLEEIKALLENKQ
jgi:hypothetical protein